MMGKWLWAGLKAVAKWIQRIFAAVWNVLSSALTWIVAGLAYLVDTVQTWVNDAISGGLETMLDSIGAGAETFPELGPLAVYWLKVLSMDEAITCLVELFAFWVLAKTARLVMVPIRALLEII